MDEKMFDFDLCRRYPKRMPRHLYLFCLAKNEAQTSMHGYTLSHQTCRANENRLGDSITRYSIYTLPSVGIWPHSLHWKNIYNIIQVIHTI